MVCWFSTRVPRQLSGERIMFCTNGLVTTRYSCAKEWSWTPSSQYMQKLTQNGS